MATDNKIKLALKWWDFLPTEERAILRDIYCIGYLANPLYILYMWEKETKPDNSLNVLDEHTPGPWEVLGELNVQSISGRPICSCGVNQGTDKSRSENLANARLIASAPELKRENERLRAENEQLKARLTEC